jgi:hypothetical protein
LIAVKNISRPSSYGLILSADHDGVDVDPNCKTELVTYHSIDGGEFLDLPPVFRTSLIALKDVGSTGRRVFTVSADHYGI